MEGPRERTRCWLCEKLTDFLSEDAYFNIDVSSKAPKLQMVKKNKVFRLNITKGCCSWAPHMEIVLCKECVTLQREKCSHIIMDLLK